MLCGAFPEKAATQNIALATQLRPWRKPVLEPGPAPVQIPHWWDTVTLFFFSAHSSYRLDKINSDMRNYITNFAADLR